MKFWVSTAPNMSDPRIRWELRWRAVRKFLISKEAEVKNERRLANAKIIELQSLRNQLASQRSTEADPRLKELDIEVADLEKRRAAEWRRWARIRWINQGNAPSKFFFRRLKAKQAKERIQFLRSDDGRQIDEESEIMKELTTFYTNLYKKDSPSEEATASYRGCPVGWSLSEKEQGEYIVGKIQRKLRNWSYRMLDFSGRLVVIRHILKAVPVLVLTVTPLHKKTLDRMEAVCRDFLWGAANGKRKIPLIAWPTASRRLWSLQEILLADPPVRITNAPTANAMLASWNSVRRFLQLNKSDCRLNGWTPVEVCLELGKRRGWFSPITAASFKGSLTRLNIKSLGQWSDWAVQAVITAEAQDADQALVSEGQSLQFQSLELQLNCWSWNKDGISFRGWILTSKFRNRLLANVEYTHEGLGISVTTTVNFLSLIDDLFSGKSLAKLIAGIEVLKAVWVERNHASYSTSRKLIPWKEVWRRVLETLVALDRKALDNPRLISRIQEARIYCNVARNRCLSMAASRSPGDENRSNLVGIASHTS
ncbi:hypothetical protein R1sor_004096 [Riccia sorocarpa]|uniref:Reverse transcriptase n=1 Tax=Riccia sorocarpa TaxID=122646 RepID=A0ABD3H9L8_9MARC